ncbi:unnamed protein product [Cunninghamella echinulata]
MSECINKYSLSILINDYHSDMTIPCSPSMSTTSTSSLSSPSPSPSHSSSPPRKGSIASMLNSMYELEQLDHEELLTNYQTHFQTNKSYTDEQQQQQHQQNQHHHKKGLRLFSQHICDIIQYYGKINYHQLVQKLCDTKGIYLTSSKSTTTCYKNIKRRVYDALNVLMAIGIIRKENKYIYWKGYPSVLIHENNDYSFDKKIEEEKEEKNDPLLKAIQQEQQRYYSLKSSILEKQYQIQQIIYQHNTFSF